VGEIPSISPRGGHFWICERARRRKRVSTEKGETAAKKCSPFLPLWRNVARPKNHLSRRGARRRPRPRPRPRERRRRIHAGAQKETLVNSTGANFAGGSRISYRGSSLSLPRECLSVTLILWSQDGFAPHLHALDFELHVVLPGGLAVFALLPAVAVSTVAHLLAGVEQHGAAFGPERERERERRNFNGAIKNEWRRMKVIHS